MSDSEDSGDLSESMLNIHKLVEKLSHDSKTIYAKALNISSQVEIPELDMWIEEFHLHEKSYPWAKHNMIPRKCSLWLIHRTLLESAKKDKRISRDKNVLLLKEEADIMELPSDRPVSVWQVLGRLPKFFIQ
jgi:hypothetical protein